MSISIKLIYLMTHQLIAWLRCFSTFWEQFPASTNLISLHECSPTFSIYIYIHNSLDAFLQPITQKWGMEVGLIDFQHLHFHRIISYAGTFKWDAVIRNFFRIYGHGMIVYNIVFFFLIWKNIINWLLSNFWKIFESLVAGHARTCNYN